MPNVDNTERLSKRELDISTEGKKVESVVSNESVESKNKQSVNTNVSKVQQIELEATQVNPSQNTPPSSPKHPPLKSPYSPIQNSHNQYLRSTSLYLPYKHPNIKSPLLSPIKRVDKDPFSTVYNEYMMIETPHRATRKLSLGTIRHQAKEINVPPLPNSHLIDFPSPSPLSMRRSRSMDLTGPRLLRRESSNRTRGYHLKIVFNTVSKDIIFSGTTLDELRNAINNCFMYLPVVKVYIEHPSIPQTLVSITDIDQLYDNATIRLLPKQL